MNVYYLTGFKVPAFVSWYCVLDRRLRQQTSLSNRLKMPSHRIFIQYGGFPRTPRLRSVVFFHGVKIAPASFQTTM